MAQHSIADQVRSDLASVLEETFRTRHGHYLDPETSLADTLATISAEEASRPVGAGCATLAAQVNHVTFCLDVVERKMRGEDVGPIDWAASWQVAAVDAGDWAALKQRLDAACDRMLATVRLAPAGDGAAEIRRALEILAHTAYHLGEIRQALCILQPERRQA